MLCQILFDFQFNFCRAVKDSRVAFFLTFFSTFIPIKFGGWTNGFNEKFLFQQGKSCLQTCIRMFAKN